MVKGISKKKAIKVIGYITKQLRNNGFSINMGDEERGRILDLYQNHGILLIRRVKRKSVQPFCMFP